MRRTTLRLILLAAATTAAAVPAETINAAGATFPAPIYQKWFEEYHKAHPDAQINYQSIGSGGGIRQFTEGTVDFGASDMPMTDQQIGDIEKGGIFIRCISPPCWAAWCPPITWRASPETSSSAAKL